MTDQPFGRPGDPAKATPFHQFPLPPAMRGYDPDADRDHYGRYRLPDPTGKAKTGRKAFTRATTMAKALDDTYNLHQWDTRNIITGIHSKRDLLDSFPEFGDYAEQRQALEAIAEDARIVAGVKEASEHGTALHAWLEFVDGGHGTLEDVPVQFREKARVYLQECEDWGLYVQEGGIERIVWHEESGVVGTLDRIYHLADGTPVIGDVKTSKDLKYSFLSISVQLATYADASLMLTEDGTDWVQMPEVDLQRAVVLWVPSNQAAYAELVPINLEIGRQALALAGEVKAARSAGTAKLIKLDKAVIPTPAEVAEAQREKAAASADVDEEAPALEAETAVDTLEDQILRATNEDDLAALYEEWAEHWTTEHTQMGRARLAQLQT